MGQRFVRPSSLIVTLVVVVGDRGVFFGRKERLLLGYRVCQRLVSGKVVLVCF